MRKCHKLRITGRIIYTQNSKSRQEKYQTTMNTQTHTTTCNSLIVSVKPPNGGKLSHLHLENLEWKTISELTA